MDVAIIGAGPAGSTLATLLASRGVGVALFDKETFPRDKLCGEFLSYDALPILEPLGVLDAIDRAGAPRIERCRVIGARTYEFAFPHPARGVSRLFFDDLLVRTAAARGAIIRTETVAALPKATVIVGAWGRWGRFDQQLARSFVNVRDRNFGFKRHYRGAHEDGAIDLHSFARGYLGVNAVEGGITNICGLVHASRLAGHKGRWDAFVEHLRAEEPRLEALYSRHEPAQEHFLSSEPVIFRARSAVEGGVLMIGDASGVIDPLTGNGMAMAIQSALLAAPMILRLLENPARRDEIENEYRQTHRDFFASRIAWSRRVAALLSRPRLLDAALSTVRAKGIGAALMKRTRASWEEVSRLADAWFC
ncbi:MAG TPA: NAD(P)/FAD-dependent oxidoreductase [Thermoanaerobaculia bacterium]|jgi:flavin-dependent dehydrogenase|nr:NAD(P)/FAD-dependent oxidoreductase [Thermoanaerobaculia bacterium]